jgi:hypothetical protein
MRIDTGSGDSVSDEAVKDSNSTQKTVLGNGIGENYSGYSGIYKAVHVGPFTFENVWGTGSPHPAIGMEMFRRFNVTFDIPHGTLYLEPNLHFREHFPSPQDDVDQRSD